MEKIKELCYWIRYEVNNKVDGADIDIMYALPDTISNDYQIMAVQNEGNDEIGVWTILENDLDNKGTINRITDEIIAKINKPLTEEKPMHNDAQTRVDFIKDTLAGVENILTKNGNVSSDVANALKEVYFAADKLYELVYMTNEATSGIGCDVYSTGGIDITPTTINKDEIKINKVNDIENN